jgi:hypothetical protein
MAAAVLAQPPVDNLPAELMRNAAEKTQQP